MIRFADLLSTGLPSPFWVRWTTAGVSGAVFACGLWWHQTGLLGIGAVGLCFMLSSRHKGLALSKRPGDRALSHLQASHPVNESGARSRPLPERWLTNPALADPPESADALVDEMLLMGRYALLLRPEMNQHMDREHLVRAVRYLDEAMALVPAGRVLLGPLAEQSSSSGGVVDANPKAMERFLHLVDALYLDRFPITNFEFQQFVASDGYEKLEFWHEEALPALLDFVDESGQPGPRYWHEGQFASGEERRPVVGVSWYEASAFARWVGKRLPTDTEWTKAGAWPVESAPGRIAQRRYPWGESFDIRRANLWGAHKGQSVDVDEYVDGESVGGVHQLVGNVWEWTASPLSATAEPSFHVPETYKSIRGGAFDTYFENHATCHYQSGEHPLSRRLNIGFRLALPMATLEVAEDELPDSEENEADEQDDVAYEEEATVEV